RAGAIPDRAGRRGTEQIVDAEVPPQFEMGPVVERVAQAVRHGGRPGRELLPGVGITGAETLGHPIGAHGPPLVVIAFEPDLGQRGETTIGGDVLRRQVTVVIENRLAGGVLVKQPARRVTVKEEVLADECHDGTSLSLDASRTAGADTKSAPACRQSFHRTGAWRRPAATPRTRLPSSRVRTRGPRPDR